MTFKGMYLNTMQGLLIVSEHTFIEKLQLNCSYHLVFDYACTVCVVSIKSGMISGVFKE